MWAHRYPSGPCVGDCEDPFYTHLSGFTMNANLLEGTFDARNTWNHVLTGGLSVTKEGPKVRKAVITGTALAGSWFRVTYNDTGTPVSVEFQLIQHERGNTRDHTRATGVLLTTQVTGV